VKSDRNAGSSFSIEPPLAAMETVIELINPEISLYEITPAV